MKILHIAASCDRRLGGSIEGALQLAQLQSIAGHEAAFATLDPPRADYLQSTPVKVYPLGSRPFYVIGWRHKLPWVKYGITTRMLPWLRANIAQYDAAIVHGLWNFSTLAARRALVGSEMAYYVFPHGMLNEWANKTYPLKAWAKQLSWWLCEGPLLNNATGVFFTAEDEKREASRLFRPSRFVGKVVGYGTTDVAGDAVAQIAAFRQTLPELGDRDYILFLSRIHEKKGCDLLIEAFSRIADRYPHLDVVIAGSSQDNLSDVLRRQASACGISSRIHWPGTISGDVKWGAFRGAHAFILPSHQENFGIVVAEALACSTPVLISNKVNIWRDIQWYEAGFVEDDTVEGTYRLLTRFLALPDHEKNRMRSAGRKCFLEKFELTAIIEHLDEDIVFGVRDHHVRR